MQKLDFILDSTKTDF